MDSPGPMNLGKVGQPCFGLSVGVTSLSVDGCPNCTLVFARGEGKMPLNFCLIEPIWDLFIC